MKQVTLFVSGKDFEVSKPPAESVEFLVPTEKPGSYQLRVEGERGAETTSASLPISIITTSVDVGPLRVWPAHVDVKREGDRLRFSWPPLEAPEVTDALRYSLLFSYRRKDGSEVQGSLVVKGGKTEAIQTLSELSEIFPDRDPSVKVMDMRIRAFGSKGYPNWAGEKQTWPVPDDLPLQEGAR